MEILAFSIDLAPCEKSIIDTRSKTVRIQCFIKAFLVLSLIGRASIGISLFIGRSYR